MRVLAYLLLIVVRFVDLGVLLAVRALVARRFGYRGVFPLVATERVSRPSSRMPRALASASGVAAIYLLSAMLSALGGVGSVRYEETGALRVEPDGAAYAAGVRTNDVIVAVDGAVVPDNGMQALRAAKQPRVLLRVRRGDEELDFEIERTIRDGVPRAGVSVLVEERTMGTWEAIGAGAVAPARVLGNVIRSIGMAIAPKEDVRLGAVVSPVAVASQSLAEGPGATLSFLGAISALLLPIYAIAAIVLVFVGWRDPRAANATV